MAVVAKKRDRRTVVGKPLTVGKERNSLEPAAPQRNADTKNTCTHPHVTCMGTHDRRPLHGQPACNGAFGWRR